MPIHLVGIAHWLLSQAGATIFRVMQGRLLENVGLQTPPLTRQTMESLLDQQFHQLEAHITGRVIDRLDEDRLARLRSGIYQLRMATTLKGMTPLKQSQLTNAHGEFAYIANLPEQRSTAGIPNEQLSCLAHLGIAAIYTEMQEPLAGIANNIVAAIYADQATARRWFGDDIINRLLTICPVCGFENKPGDRFCPRDGEPLVASSSVSSAGHANSSGASSHPPLFAYCPVGHRVTPGTTSCPVCKRAIHAAYCSRRHANLLGAARCSQCGEELAS